MGRLIRAPNREQSLAVGIVPLLVACQIDHWNQLGYLVNSEFTHVQVQGQAQRFQVSYAV